MSIRTSVGQVAMAGGSRSDRPSGTLVDERASYSARARRRGNLYALVEISGPAAGRDVVARQLLEAVRETYYAWQGSITAGLQQAIRTVNSWLFDENRDSLPHDQRTAGISCAVLRDNDLFIAQAGPAAVYLAQAGQVARFPEVSPWLDELPLEDADAAPLGARRDLNVALYHTQVTEGDLLLLAESAIARRLTPHAWAGVLARPTSEAVLGSLLAAGGGIDLSAVAVRMEGEAAAEAPLPAALPSPALAGGAPRAAIGAHPAAAQPRRSLQHRMAAWVDRYRVRDWMRKAGRALLVALAALWAALKTLLQRILPGQVSPAPLPSTRAGPARWGAQMAPAPQARKRTARDVQPQPRSERVRKALVGLAILIPVAVLIIVLSLAAGHSRSQRAARATAEASWQQAGQSWEQAQQSQTAGDREAARAHLNDARTALEEVIKRQPGHSEARALLKQVVALQDQVNEVERILWTGKLMTYPAGAKLSRVVVEDSHVFVMDRNAGKVYHHRLDSSRQALEPETAETVLVKKGDHVGGVLVSNLVDMVWVSAGPGRQRAALAILESGGKLLEYDPATGELSAPAISDAVTFENPKLVGSYYGSLYVLDLKVSKIWRYLPTADGYSDPPDPPGGRLNQPADLSLVVDMAIADSIYLLYADGTIRRFTGGDADDYAMTDWDAPLRQNPGAIFTRPPDEWRSVYVADTGNSRIVQTDFGGLFQRQYRLHEESAAEGGNSLSAVTSLFVNEISGQAFYTSGNELYVAILPTPGTP